MITNRLFCETISRARSRGGETTLYVSTVRELFTFLWKRKLWWLIPLVVSLLLIGFFVGAIVFLSPAVNDEMSQPEALLLQDANPLSETITLLDDRAENKSLNVIFAVNERASVRRYGP